MKETTNAFLCRLGFLLRKETPTTIKPALIKAFESASKIFVEDLNFQLIMDLLFGYSKGRMSSLILDLQKIIASSDLKREEIEPVLKLILEVK